MLFGLQVPRACVTNTRLLLVQETAVNFRPPSYLLNFSAAWMLFSVAACGGSQGQIAKSLADRETSTYLKVCEERAARQTSDLSSGAYNPPVLYVHDWPGETQKLLPESRFVAVLEGGEVKNVVVMARGGLGKSRLAESVRAQLCAALPVFSVDLKEVAKVTTPGNAVLAVIAKDAGLDAALLAPQLAEGRLLVLADGIEEVDLVNRAKVMTALRELSAQVPAAQIVLLARPAVLDADYGFTPVDAKLEIQPLECKTTEAFVARSYKDEATREQFKLFLKRYDLDDQAKFGVQCTYPYLSTYRDVLTLADFHQKALDPASGIIASRSNVYETLVGVRLKKELENLGWTQVEALDMVDRMLRVQIETKGFREPRFELEGCMRAIDARWGSTAVDAGIAGTPDERRRHVCEKTFQSALFVPADAKGNYKFTDTATTDLFLARWLNGLLGREPNFDCGVLKKQPDLLGSIGVVEFLVGQPLGQRCLAQLVDDRCGRDPKAAQDVSVFADGLPIGAPRKQALADAHAVESTTKNKACVMSALKSLDGTLSSP